MTQVWIYAKPFQNFNRNGIRILWSVWQVIIMAVNATVTLLQIRMSPMMEVGNHLFLQVYEVICESYSFSRLIYIFMMWIIIIFDVDYFYFRRELWWSLLFFLSMWCIYFHFILQSLIFQKIKQTMRSQKIIHIPKVCLSGDAFSSSNIS